MKIHAQSSDVAILDELGTRLGRARLDLNLSQAELAREAGVSKRTVERLEAGHSTQLTNLIRVLRALRLSEQLDALVPEAAVSPIQQLQLKGRSRERASPSTRKRARADTWTWGDDT